MGQVCYGPPEQDLSLLDAMTPRLCGKGGALALQTSDGTEWAVFGPSRVLRGSVSIGTFRYVPSVHARYMDVTSTLPEDEGSSPLPRAGTANDVRARPERDHSPRGP
jgi:hypothetical protein